MNSGVHRDPFTVHMEAEGQPSGGPEKVPLGPIGPIGPCDALWFKFLLHCDKRALRVICNALQLPLLVSQGKPWA